tara:strand:+ start:209 stop:1225 length:1017 start_codon:yes stop_codon:yes gene_type:complete
VKNFQPNFSHIYIEENAKDYPLSKLAIEKFSKSTIIQIKHYKDVFNRPNQDFQIQKSSMKLILAKKTAPFLYPASEMVQEFGSPNVFYNTPILNCLYNCDYCFLQGMYNSGNMVVFVNENDFMSAITEKMRSLNVIQNPMIVAISYNTDIMAMENILPLASRWINFAKHQKNLIIEIRTKSALFSLIEKMNPSRAIILSWTLSPEIISAKFESTSPPFKSRLSSAKSAVEKDWQVRLCFDPVILFEGWFEIYTAFFNEVFNNIDSKKIRDVTIGVFRMNKDFYKRIKKREPTSELFYQDYEIKDGVVSLEKNVRIKALKKVKKVLAKYLPENKILTWM